MGLTACAYNIRSLHNVGAIYRTADGAGFSAVACAGYTGTPPDPRISKVALGADESLATFHLPTDEELQDFLAGATVILMEQHPSSTPVHALEAHDPPDPSQSIVLIACEELFGAPTWLVERADIILEIPMHGDKESLNVSVAFGIAAYAVRSWALGDDPDGLRSREAPRPVREGVLTHGVTNGQIPAGQ